MNRPICCGKPATPYYRLYGRKGVEHSFESGFRCKQCGRIRIPFATQWDDSYMLSLEAVRLRGIALDNQ